MLTIPDQYVVEKFCQYSGYPTFNKRSNAWMGGCPICREGKSWGKKRRLYYKLEKNYIFCFNCGWKGGTVEFIKHVTGLTFSEIVKESGEYDTDNITAVEKNIQPKPVSDDNIPTLPTDSINLYDESQTKWWSDSANVARCIKYIQDRKLDVAINRPRSLWLSLNDYIHKNRLIIPFYSNDKKIIFYQSRSLVKNDNRPKYLGKSGGEKSIFNIDNIDTNLSSIFIFEGPIDSFFVKNGIAVAGITSGPGQDLNKLQQKQLNDYRLYDKIWVLDSQWLDDTSYSKTKMLIEQGETVFIWPESIGRKYKDINELCVSIDQPGIGYKYILNNSYTGMKASLLLNSITNR